MKAIELRQKTQDELKTVLDELHKEQFNLRMQQGTGQLSRHTRVKEVRKDIARIKTLMNEKKPGNAS